MDLPIACIYCYNIAIGKQLDRWTEDRGLATARKYRKYWLIYVVYMNLPRFDIF